MGLEMREFSPVFGRNFGPAPGGPLARRRRRAGEWAATRWIGTAPPDSVSRVMPPEAHHGWRIIAEQAKEPRRNVHADRRADRLSKSMWEDPNAVLRFVLPRKS